MIPRRSTQSILAAVRRSSSALRPAGSLSELLLIVSYCSGTLTENSNSVRNSHVLTYVILSSVTKSRTALSLSFLNGNNVSLLWMLSFHSMLDQPLLFRVAAADHWMQIGLGIVCGSRQPLRSWKICPWISDYWVERVDSSFFLGLGNGTAKKYCLLLSSQQHGPTT